MKCPHCLVTVHIEEHRTPLGIEDEHNRNWGVVTAICPHCGEPVIRLIRAREFDDAYIEGIDVNLMAWPRQSQRPPPSGNVPEDLKKHYLQAALIMNDSPEASAALSRRCLQQLLHKHGYKARDLSKEIDQLLENAGLPAYLAKSVDAIRWTGNFATHPIKSTSSGEIVEVEVGEAEWNLDVLDGLFNFFYDLPALVGKKVEAMNKKLKDADRPPLKA